MTALKMALSLVPLMRRADMARMMKAAGRFMMPGSSSNGEAARAWGKWKPIWWQSFMK